MKRMITAIVLAGTLVAATGFAERETLMNEPVVGGPCEGCEAVFVGLPDSLGSHARIAPAGERGEPLRIDGTVRDARGHAVAGVILYAYQTNAQGIYPRIEPQPGRTVVRHGRLRAWVKTDAQGRYRFDTIRPASYPKTTIPQHVHMHVIEPGRCTYYISDIVFDDDPHLTPAQRRSMVSERGGSGLVVPKREASGRWVVTRDVVLGKEVPGYDRIGREREPGTKRTGDT